jgi:hypothetical protein
MGLNLKVVPAGPEAPPGSLAAATALLDTVPLAGRIVTADALLTQRARREQIVRRGGDFRVDFAIVDTCNASGAPFRTFVGGGVGVP